MFDISALILAQAAPEAGGGEAPVVAPGAPAPTPVPLDGQAVEGADGTPITPGDPQQTTQPQSPMNGFFLMLLILVLFMFVLIIPQRREKKRRAAMLDAIKKGDRIQTVGGIIGTVIELRDSEAIVKVDENTNTRMRFSRNAIQSVVGGDDGSAA